MLHGEFRDLNKVNASEDCAMKDTIMPRLQIPSVIFIVLLYYFLEYFCFFLDVVIMVSSFYYICFSVLDFHRMIES